MDGLGTRLNPAQMSALQPTSREEINEFLQAGHAKYVGTEERFVIIQQVLNRKRHVELGLSDLAISEKRRPVRIESESPRRSHRLTATPSARIARGGFFDQRRRLTNRAKEIVTRPQIKLGIFNNFSKSKNVKMRTFDEAQLNEFEPIELAEPDHLAENRLEVIKSIEELASDRSDYPIQPIRKLSVIELSIQQESEPRCNQDDTSETISDYTYACFLDLLLLSSEIESMLGLCSSDGSDCDDFSSAISDISSSVL